MRSDWDPVGGPGWPGIYSDRRLCGRVRGSRRTKLELIPVDPGEALLMVIPSIHTHALMVIPSIHTHALMVISSIHTHALGGLREPRLLVVFFSILESLLHDQLYFLVFSLRGFQIVFSFAFSTFSRRGGGVCSAEVSTTTLRRRRRAGAGGPGGEASRLGVCVAAMGDAVELPAPRLLSLLPNAHAPRRQQKSAGFRRAVAGSYVHSFVYSLYTVTDVGLCTSTLCKRGGVYGCTLVMDRYTM